eukprot:6913580-Prymnesium_polylepis.1
MPMHALRQARAASEGRPSINSLPTVELDDAAELPMTPQVEALRELDARLADWYHVTAGLVVTR